jgi:hypothetical protein
MFTIFRKWIAGSLFYEVFPEFGLAGYFAALEELDRYVVVSLITVEAL